MHGTHPITKFAKNYITDGFIRFTRADRNAVSMSFGLLEMLGNSFNWIIIVVMSILGVIWIKKMGDYNREAKEKGTLK